MTGRHEQDGKFFQRIRGVPVLLDDLRTLQHVVLCLDEGLASRRVLTVAPAKDGTDSNRLVVGRFDAVVSVVLVRGSAQLAVKHPSCQYAIRRTPYGMSVEEIDALLVIFVAPRVVFFGNTQ